MALLGESRESYLNVRVRMQRLPDAKFFSGWVRMMSDTEIVIDFQGNEWFDAGTKFFITVNGVETAAMFPAELVSQSTGFMNLKMLKEIKYAHPTEEARRQVLGLSGVIKMQETEIELVVTDVSAKGMGGIIEGAIPRGEIIDIQLQTQFGEVFTKGEVRYCRQESKESIRHRVGLRITQMGRIETARWLRLSEDKVA